MNEEGVDKGRRRFLTATTVVIGGIGAAYTAVPFLASWKPSAKAQAAGAPVEVDIGRLEPGQRINVEWRGKPVWIIRRSEETLEELTEIDNLLRDPDSEVADQQPAYAQNEFRAIKPEYLVVVGICTHLGCSPVYRPEPGAADLGADWPGGFFCPCHGSKFDLAGRVFKSVPAPTNLVVPPHRYVSDTRLLIGEDQEAA
jgi:ubiquinol-cytochrome c reductase iron-sulfur subunit